MFIILVSFQISEMYSTYILIDVPKVLPRSPSVTAFDYNDNIVIFNCDIKELHITKSKVPTGW